MSSNTIVYVDGSTYFLRRLRAAWREVCGSDGLVREAWSATWAGVVDFLPEPPAFAVIDLSTVGDLRTRLRLITSLSKKGIKVVAVANDIGSFRLATEAGAYTFASKLEVESVEELYRWLKRVWELPLRGPWSKR